MHVIHVMPDADHPLYDMLEDVKKARAKANGHVDMWIPKRMQQRVELEKDLLAKKNETIKKYREYFPEHKDYEIKVVPIFPRGNYVVMVIEVKIPYIS